MSDTDPTQCPAVTGREWRCRRCAWHGSVAEGRPSNDHGWLYWAALCPSCGSYFNEQDFAAAGILPQPVQ